MSSHFVCHDVNNIDDALCEAFLWLKFAIYVQIHGIRLKLISWNKYIVSVDISSLLISRSLSSPFSLEYNWNAYSLHGSAYRRQYWRSIHIKH